MCGALKEGLTQQFPWLFDDLGFHVAGHDFSCKAMGSSHCVIESDRLRVRFENDRGFLNVEVAPLTEPERWMNLSALWLCLDGRRPTPELDGWTAFLRNHLDRIADALGPKYDATRIAFDRQTAVRAAGANSGSAAARVRRAATIARIRTFVQGPLGWIAAALLLFYLAVR